MARLLTMACPGCGQLLESREFTPNAMGGAKKATGYEDCLRRCDACEIGLSNTKNAKNVVPIHRDPLSNLPQEVREGALETLGRSLNVINRKSKRKSFCSENSEDAVTWTVFRYLQQAGHLRTVFAELGVLPAVESAEEPCLLLWGVSVPLKTSHAGWPAYIENTEAFRNPEGVKTTKLYELARNWRIGWQYADDRRLSLINLGPSDLFKKSKEDDLLALFSSGLSLDHHHAFQRLVWRQLMQAIPNKPRWLLAYDSDRGLSVDRTAS